MKKRTLLDDASYLNYLDWLAERVPPERLDATYLTASFYMTRAEAERLFELWKQKGVKT